eukprot:560608-Rhodomonas_salina.2
MTVAYSFASTYNVAVKPLGSGTWNSYPNVTKVPTVTLSVVQIQAAELFCTLASHGSWQSGALDVSALRADLKHFHHQREIWVEAEGGTIPKCC